MKKRFEKLLFLISIVLMMLFACSFFLLFKKVDDNKKISEQTLNTWKTEALRRDEIRNLQHSIKEIENEKELLETHFIRSSNAVPFLDMLEDFGAKVGAKVVINSINILEGGKSLSTEFKATGNFEAIYKILTLLENSPYEIKINSVDFRKTINQDTTKETTGKWEGNFKIGLLSFIP